MKKEELKKLLEYHDNLYYNNDNPEITDIEYDAIKAEYIALAGEYDYVPGEASSDSVKYNHPVPILSLDKVQITDEEKLRKEIERLWPVIIQPKMDGLTLVTYPDGSHVTRGNGKIGEVITDNVNAGVEGLGTINHLTVRSEVVILKSKFEEINKKRVACGEEPFKNPRNAAAGMLRQKDASKAEGLTAFAYNVVSEEERNNSYPQLLALQTYDWNTVLSYSPETIDDAIEYIKNFNREELDYEIDGLVIKYDGIKQFGTTGHHPKNAIAVKFAAEGEWTTLKSVTWQVGKSGILAPVGEIVPVEIMGSTISRVTLHNIGIIKALDLKINGNVHVIKANDVIPRVVGSDNSVEAINISLPSFCPCCGSATELKNDILYCTGSSCPAQLAGKIALLASRDALDIEGLSEATIEKMINFVENNYAPGSLSACGFCLPFHMSYEDILQLEGFAIKSAKKLYDNIQKAKDTDLKRFIYAANIPLIGRSASEDIANSLRTFSNLLFQVDNNFEDIKALPDFGPKMIESLRDNARESFFKLWEAGVRPRDMEIKPPVKAVSEVLTFVITGAFEISRNEIEELIKANGHKVSKKVSSKTSYLLASPGEEGTSKYIDAKSKGIKMIHTLDELKKIL